MLYFLNRVVVSQVFITLVLIASVCLKYIIIFKGVNGKFVEYKNSLEEGLLREGHGWA